MNRNAWVGSSNSRKTPWGIEVTWSALPTITGKKLEITAGKCTSLKIHRQKNEVFFVAGGQVRAIFADEGHFADPINHPARQQMLREGDLLNVQAGCPYRLCALEDSVVYEISDGSAQLPSIRLEDEYGRPIDANIDRYRFIYPRD